MPSSHSFDREAFLQALATRFPKIAANISPIESGLLHPEMAVVSQATQEAIAEQDWEAIASHFAFVEEVLVGADEAVKNAVYVSYVENVFLGETSANYISARAMLPSTLAQALLELEAHFEMLTHAKRDA